MNGGNHIPSKQKQIPIYLLDFYYKKIYKTLHYNQKFILP